MSELYATAAAGTEDLVAGELLELGMAGVRRGRGGVSFAGDLSAGMRACLHLSTAMRVLMPLARFPAHDADSLYQGVAAVPWEEHLDARHTISVAATTRAPPPLAHGPFLGQKVKDAIVDRLRARLGARPDVARKDPDVSIYVHAAPREVTVGLDLAGDSLHLRGYRMVSTTAPLRETLAAALLLAAGWDGARPLVDPMCGSGTIAIEAALRARRIAPGRKRRFGFERWPRFGEAERAAWRRLVEEARAAELPASPMPIVAADRDAEAIAATETNARAAGVSLECRVADAREVAPTVPPGVLVSNPPYGERLGGSALEGFFRAFGARLRTLDGHTAFLLCGSAGIVRALGMRPTWQRKLMNGPLPVLLCRYELGKQRRGN